MCLIIEYFLKNMYVLNYFHLHHSLTVIKLPFYHHLPSSCYRDSDYAIKPGCLTSEYSLYP